MKFPAAETAVRVRAWKKKERRKRGKTRGTVRESLTRSIEDAFDSRKS